MILASVCQIPQKDLLQWYLHVRTKSLSSATVRLFQIKEHILTLRDCEALQATMLQSRRENKERDFDERRKGESCRRIRPMAVGVKNFGLINNGKEQPYP